MSTTIRAAGAVVLRPGSDEPEVLVVHRPRYDDWSLPKGKLDDGESAPAAAVREVAEETGVRIRLSTPLDTTRYRTDQGRKEVHWWIGVPLTQTEAAAVDVDEVDEVAWWPASRAMMKLTQVAEQELVARGVETPPTTPFVMLRHGKARDRKSWDAPDGERPLAPRGVEQAEELVVLLGAYGIECVATSPWKRCLNTVQPYAEATGHKIDRVPAITERAMKERPEKVGPSVRKLAKKAIGGVPTVVCGHRPVFPSMFEAIKVGKRSLNPGGAVVVHYTAAGDVHAIEVHATEA